MPVLAPNIPAPAASAPQREPLQMLREACHAQHEALHQHPLLAPLNVHWGMALSMADYGYILGAFQNAYAIMEAEAFYTPLPSAPVLAWLQQDMQQHHIAPVSLTMPPYPTIDSFSKLVGYLYVKQGSMLGGHVISRRLQDQLGLVANDTNHFFAGYGAENGAKWKDFAAGVNAHASNLNMAETIAQAQATFDYIATSADLMQERKSLC